MIKTHNTKKHLFSYTHFDGLKFNFVNIVAFDATRFFKKALKATQYLSLYLHVLVVARSLDFYQSYGSWPRSVAAII